MRYAAIAVVLVLVAAVLIVFNHEMGGRLNPSGGMTGGECQQGDTECRRVAVIATGVGTPVPTFVRADFDKQKAWKLGSGHVALPGCGTGGATGYYAYAQPVAEGPLATFEVAQGPSQLHGLAPQSGTLDFDGVDHGVLVSANLLECDQFENQTVRVVP